MDSQKHHELTDGTIYLRPLSAEDAGDHLAGEDDEMARWLSGGRSTLANVEAFIASCQENWRNGGPRRAFGVFQCTTDKLVGCVEANLTLLPDPAQINVSYGVFREWRGQGIALRAINLMGQYLRAATEAREMVLRISTDNVASRKVAQRGGFTFCGVFDEREGRLEHYVRRLED